MTANCGEAACGSDFYTYACSTSGWSWTGQACACQCTGTGPGGVPVTVSCGQTACGSDYVSYACSADGWAFTGNACTGNGDAGAGDAGSVLDCASLGLAMTITPDQGIVPFSSTIAVAAPPDALSVAILVDGVVIAEEPTATWQLDSEGPRVVVAKIRLAEGECTIGPRRISAVVPQTLAHGVIGPQGGTLTLWSANGSPYAGATFTVPPGALDQPTNLQILDLGELHTADMPGSRALQLLPSGAVFHTPARLTVPAPDLVGKDCSALATQAQLASDQGANETIQIVGVNCVAGTVDYSIPHFSRLWLVNFWDALEFGRDVWDKYRFISDDLTPQLANAATLIYDRLNRVAAQKELSEILRDQRDPATEANLSVAFNHVFTIRQMHRLLTGQVGQASDQDNFWSAMKLLRFYQGRDQRFEALRDLSNFVGNQLWKRISELAIPLQIASAQVKAAFTAIANWDHLAVYEQFLRYVNGRRENAIAWDADAQRPIISPEADEYPVSHPAGGINYAWFEIGSLQPSSIGGNDPVHWQAFEILYQALLADESVLEAEENRLLELMADAAEQRALAAKQGWTWVVTSEPAVDQGSPWRTDARDPEAAVTITGGESLNVDLSQSEGNPTKVVYTLEDRSEAGMGRIVATQESSGRDGLVYQSQLLLAGSYQLSVDVTVADEVHTLTLDVTAQHVPPPQPEFVTPAPGATVGAGQPFEVAAQARDGQGALVAGATIRTFARHSGDTNPFHYIYQDAPATQLAFHSTMTLEPGRYELVAEAKGPSGDKGQVTQSLLVVLPAPVQVQVVRATLDQTDRITWNAVPSAADYVVRWAESPAVDESSPTLPSTAGTSVDCSIGPDAGPRYYRVFARTALADEGLGSAVVGVAQQVPGSSRLAVTEVAAGAGHSCALKSDGTVACFGGNANGAATPPAGTFKQISAGTHYTCGVRTDSTLACWGVIAMPPAGAFTEVAAGAYHACAIQVGGGITCWGSDTAGSTNPPSGIFTQVTSGDGHSCAVAEGGTLACWGKNYAAGSTFPGVGGQASPPEGTFSQVSAGYEYTCGVRTDGSVACWGVSWYGSRGIPPVGSFVQVAVGGSYSCGIRLDDGVSCWGQGQATPPAGAFAKLSAGTSHMCGVTTEGEVACWGGEGSGETSPRIGPFAHIAGSIGACGSYQCGLKLDGSVQCWGSNYQGRTTPAAGTFVRVAVGCNHACGIRSDNTLACWGANNHGEATPPAGAFVQVAPGWDHSCALTPDGSIKCWGDNTWGQATPPVGTFTQVAAGGGELTDWSGTTHRGGFACGLKSDGTIVCWGENTLGRATPPAGRFTQVSTGGFDGCGLGVDGSVACWGGDINGPMLSPPGLFAQVSSTYFYDCGLKQDGSATCWRQSEVPMSLPTTAPFSQIVAGDNFAVGLSTSGEVWEWGSEARQPL